MAEEKKPTKQKKFLGLPEDEFNDLFQKRIRKFEEEQKEWQRKNKLKKFAEEYVDAETGEGNRFGLGGAGARDLKTNDIEKRYEDQEIRKGWEYRNMLPDGKGGFRQALKSGGKVRKKKSGGKVYSNKTRPANYK
jgi:hypothetical protein